MAAQDRVRWDQIYQGQAGKPYPDPDPLLFDYTPPAPPDGSVVALDLAGGLGQNGLWLAAQGYITDIMDISRVALARARAEMAMRNLRAVNLIQVDLDALTLAKAHYDLICVFRYLRRDSFLTLRAALKPGGRLIYETFNLAYLEHVPAFNREFLLRPGELAAAFIDWRVLLHHEADHITQFVVVNQPAEHHDPEDALIAKW
jgi:SAM-dependent methyltransferase